MSVANTTSEQLTLEHRGYRLIKKIGQGSYAIVYLAEFINPPDSRNKQLSCKVIETKKSPKDFVKKFLPRELDVLVKVNHPHIIHVHSIFQRKTKYYIFMRYAENGDLLEYILHKGSISEAQARVWMRQIVLAIQYLHEMGIVHRDLKCENCLITSNYNLKLADFGFARFMPNPKATSTTYCGSLSYAAPEVLRGLPYQPRASDVWSLGVILYVILNKSMPFDDSSVKWLYEQQMGRRWKFRSKVENTLSDNVKKLLPLILEPEVSKRCTIEDILSSDWMKMDPRLMVLTSAENLALRSATEKTKSNTNDVNDEEKDGIRILKTDDYNNKKSIVVPA